MVVSLVLVNANSRNGIQSWDFSFGPSMFSAYAFSPRRRFVKVSLLSYHFVKSLKWIWKYPSTSLISKILKLLSSTSMINRLSLVSFLLVAGGGRSTRKKLGSVSMKWQCCSSESSRQSLTRAFYNFHFNYSLYKSPEQKSIYLITSLLKLDASSIIASELKLMTATTMSCSYIILV